jgi:uroporphyrin-III C-methyltransferase
MTAPRPCVTLLGAGPGDPELLTVKAVHALRRASVVLIDDLAGDGVLRYVRRSARIVRVGKRGGCVSTSQAFIDRLMVSEARRGERVVRVKGGDPFVFGRGGEEADALREAGVDVEVIGGITSGIAAPAAIGIPVTDRRHAPGVAFVTGHVRDGGTEPDWAALARSGLTLVIYMGMSRCAELSAALIAGGRDAAMPAAVVQHACTPRMRSHLTTLGRLADDVRRHGLRSPAVIVVGDVVRMALEPGIVRHAADDVRRAVDTRAAGARAT